MILRPQTPLLGAKVNMAQPLARGLLAYYPLNEAGGSGINDATPQGNKGLATGTIPFPLWSGSPIGSAINHAGASYVKIPYTPSLALSGAFTVAGWVNVTTMPSSGQLMDFMTGAYVSGDGLVPFAFEIHNNAGTTRLRYYVGTTIVFTWDFTASTFPAGVWHHVAMLSDGVTGRIYVNGISVASAASTGAVLSVNHDWAIGSLLIDGVAGRLLNGRQAHWGVWSRGLKESEVRELYGNPFKLFQRTPIWFVEAGDTTTTQTITGVFRVQTTTTQTLAGLFRVEVTSTQTITGVFNVQTTATQTIDGIFRVEATTTNTITGVFAVAGTTTKTIAGVFRVQKASTQIIGGTFRIRGVPDVDLILRSEKEESITAEDNDYNFNLLQTFAVGVEYELEQKLDKANNLSEVANAVTSFNNIKQQATLTTTGVRKLSSYCHYRWPGDNGDTNTTTVFYKPILFTGGILSASADWGDVDHEDETDCEVAAPKYVGDTDKTFMVVCTGTMYYDSTGAAYEDIELCFYKNPTSTYSAPYCSLNTGTATQATTRMIHGGIGVNLYVNFSMQACILLTYGDTIVLYMKNRTRVSTIYFENVQINFLEIPTT
jgi:hypothetical protein